VPTCSVVMAILAILTNMKGRVRLIGVYPSARGSLTDPVIGAAALAELNPGGEGIDVLHEIFIVGRKWRAENGRTDGGGEISDHNQPGDRRETRRIIIAAGYSWLLVPGVRIACGCWILAQRPGAVLSLSQGLCRR
jgi:hypothetical protein